MSKLVFNRDGGKTDEFGHNLVIKRALQGEVAEGLNVSANGVPNMSVNVAAGTGLIPTGSGSTGYKYEIGLDAVENVAIPTANGSNPRNDMVVLWVDKAVAASQSFTNNSNNMLKISVVSGVPATTPADPSIAAIQAAIGAANPYIILARVLVGAGVTQISNGNVTDLRSIVKPNSSVLAEIMKAMYPVGSIYTNATDGTNPASLLGFGTWAAFAAGRVPVGIDPTQTEFDTAGKTGGAKTHTLTIPEMPSHNHNVTVRGAINKPEGTGGAFTTSIDNYTTTTTNTGGGGAHNNLQPYVVVYMWRRTA